MKRIMKTSVFDAKRNRTGIFLSAYHMLSIEREVLWMFTCSLNIWIWDSFGIIIRICPKHSWDWSPVVKDEDMQSWDSSIRNNGVHPYRSLHLKLRVTILDRNKAWPSQQPTSVWSQWRKSLSDILKQDTVENSKGHIPWQTGANGKAVKLRLIPSQFSWMFSLILLSLHHFYISNSSIMF